MKNIFFYDKGIKQQSPNDFVVWLPRLHNIHELYKELGKVFHFSDDSCGSWDAFREQFYYLNVDEIEQCNIHIYHESIAKIIPTWDLAMYLSVINEFITEHMQDISSHQLFFYFNIKEADTIAKYWPGKLVIEESWGGECDRIHNFVKRMRYYRIIEDGYDKKGGVMYTPSDKTFPIACDAKEVVDWQSLVVELKDGDYCHFCQCTGGANMVSKEFKDVLCQYIPDDYAVEFLPVKVKSNEYGDREYYILHFTMIFDVIDKNSTIYVDGTDAIIKLALDYDKVRNLHLFNSQPSISDVIISDEIRHQLKKEKLDEGIEFVPITCVKR